MEPLSDHVSVNVEVGIPIQKHSPLVKCIYNYSRANVQDMSQSLEGFSRAYRVDFDSRTVEENWKLFKDKMLELCNQFIPKVNIRSSAEKPWFSHHIKKLLNKKQRHFRQAKISRSLIAFAKYDEIHQMCVNEIKKAKNKFFNEDLRGLIKTNPKKFWNAVNPKYTSNQFHFTDSSGDELDAADVCERFGNFFSEMFSDETFPLPILSPEDSILTQMAPITMCATGIQKLIENLPTNSAPGPDNISTKLLKLCKYEASTLLCLLFQQSLQTGIIPANWKEANVTPIFKSGQRNELTNYRPISLTSVPSKLMEHIIFSNIMDHLSVNNLLFVNQHGFRRYHSCETQLFEFVTDLHQNLHSKTETHAIFIDFQKAFDKVPHQRLLLKLRALQIEPSVIQWISNFLVDRSQSVCYECESSCQGKVRSGVPQGTVLGPLLFLLYINDLSATIQSTIRLYADDCVIYRKISSVHDCIELQNDLIKIETWCLKWQMNINISKTKFLNFSTKRSPADFNYTLFDGVLEHVHTYKYLGVYFASNISWEAHINHISAKANQSLGFLRRNLHMANWETKLVAYTTLIRSQLEYASIIWNPHQLFLTQKLELVQNRATRFILKNYTRTSITSLKEKLGLPPLADRRKISRLASLHTLYYHCPSKRELYCRAAPHISARTDNSQKLHLVTPRTNLFKFSPLQLASYEWNSLPDNIVIIQESSAFRDSLNTYLYA